MNRSDVDKAKENGSDVTPSTKTLLICGVSSTETENRLIDNGFVMYKPQAKLVTYDIKKS